MRLYERLYRNISGLHDDNAGVTPYGTSFSRSEPRKTVSSAWYARWPNSAVPRKPLNSVPGSGNGKKTGGAWCVCLTMAPVNYTCSVCFGSMPSMPNSISRGRYSIPQSECGDVRRAFIWPASYKACTRSMAAPTNIFGGASIVGVISWTVETRMSSISASTMSIRLIRTTTRKSNTFIGSMKSHQINHY